MYRSIIKPILFSLTIERAHRAVLILLRAIGLIPGGRWLLRKCYAVKHPALEREVFGIKFANPVGLAAGFDRNGEAFRELAALGFGFVEVGTVTPRPQAGNPRPRVFRLPKDEAIINRIGLSNRGLEKTIQHLRRPHEGFIVGCNIGRNTATLAENAAADYLKLFRNLYQYADYFTVNISCDNSCREGATHTREHILRILDPLFDFRRGQNQYRPIMLKVSPDMPDAVIDEISDILLETPLDGIVATNGTHNREGLHTSRTTLDKIGSGRLSGAPLTQRAVEVVRRIHTRSGGNFPIIGVGGIMTPDDAKAMLDAGADLLQLYTRQRRNNPQKNSPRRNLPKHSRKPKTPNRRLRNPGLRRNPVPTPNSRSPESKTPLMKATIITIGDEILIGQIVDTNSVSIARHLNAAGIVVHEKVSIGDDSAQIVGCVERALGQSDIAIITGGLGPTKDDITKKTLAEMFGSELIPNQTVSDHVKRMLEERGIEFNDLNRGQALVPACCTVLFNAHGTAPGMWFERGGKVVVSLPGVPYEMEHLMQDEVMPRLKAHFELRQIVHRTMITAGLPESMLAKAIETWENALPPYLKLAYLPNPGAVRLRLSAYEVEGESVSKEIERQFEALRRIIPHNIIGYETATMQELIHKLLTERRQTLATAESCTGGTIAARFTAMPGASAYFLCGVVSYSNASKQAVLGVDPDTIARYGAVSEQVARQMAEGARRISGADYAVSTTGIAGPAGGTAEKPVGTVWIAVAGPRRTVALLKQCGSDRGQIIDRAGAFALGLLRDELNGK